ncbi:hypothetical protein EDB87DRAFT_1820932 [Lactarius vividus]|nr:hypothetical protein EDB87DRAFT_1820932 [Lactarius vividus]
MVAWNSEMDSSVICYFIPEDPTLAGVRHHCRFTSWVTSTCVLGVRNGTELAPSARLQHTKEPLGDDPRSVHETRECALDERVAAPVRRRGDPNAMSVNPGKVMSSGFSTFVPKRGRRAHIVILDETQENVNLFKYLTLGKLIKWDFSPVFISPYDDGYTPAWTAAACRVFEERDKYRGKYLVPYGTIREASKDAQREDLAKETCETIEKVLEDFGWTTSRDQTMMTSYFLTHRAQQQRFGFQKSDRLLNKTKPWHEQVIMTVREETVET